MSISKVKQIRLETTAQYQPISDLNVRFFNQDINTSVLDFIVTRNSDPVLLGIDNIEATIVLTSNKFKISDEVKIKDGLNGILTYTLPDDILERHGKVTGQIYIGIKGKEDTVVQRLFSFDIEDSLINSFDAETKLVYIRKFDQLEEQISQRVESIEQAIAHSEDYVTKVIQEKDVALSQIDASKINILEEMTTLFDTEKSNLQAIGEGYKTQFEQVDVELNQKIEDIKQEINPETYVTQIQSDNWQKYKLTNDSGNANVVTGLDMENIEEKITKAGYYWLTSITNGPVNINGVLLAIHGASDSYKKFIYTPHNSNRVFLKSKNGSAWTGWEEISNNPTDTGWLEVMLKNNVTSINPVNYKIVTMNNTKQLSIKGSISNIAADSEVNFGKIPSIETIGVPYIINTFPSNIKMWIENDGELKARTPVDWDLTSTIDFSSTLIL